jgi:hypothetical protein
MMAVTQKCRRIVAVAAVNDDGILQGNLAKSPSIEHGDLPLRVERGHVSASAAYNAGMRGQDADVIVFVHQDVYLPAGWFGRLERAVDHLDGRDPRWAVLGVLGVTSARTTVGRAWSAGIGREVGKGGESLVPVVSLDELVIVLRASSGLAFDESLPGFHLYGTDIVQQALATGQTAYVFDGPVIHNSRSLRRLDARYWRCYYHQRRKWRDRLPVWTPTASLERSLLVQLRHELSSLRRGVWASRRRVEGALAPALLAARLGYCEQNEAMEVSACS